MPGPELLMDVKRVPFARVISVHIRAKVTALCAVNRRAVVFQPFAHRFQHVNGLFGNRSVRLWPDVQQIVATAARAIDQVGHHRLRRLPRVVIAVEPPAVIEGHAALPGAPRLGGAHLLLWRGEIAFETIAVVHDDLRLQPEDHRVHPLGLPLGGRQRPVDVVPQHVDLAVVGHQLANQPVRVFNKPAARRRIGLAGGPVRVMPVHQRVVEAHAQSLRASRIHKLAHQVAAWPLLGGAVVGQLGVPVAEALMVLGCHHHVLLSRGFGQPRPVPRRVRPGMELLGQQLVLRNRDAFHFLGPLVLAKHRIQSPVNEHPKPGLMPPSHAICLRGDPRGL